MGLGLGEQVTWLLVLAVPVASVSWTVTHEEVFREPRELCRRYSETCRSLLRRKFFYLFTCEYCFSHYVAASFVWLTGFRLLLGGWRGAVVGLFGLVAVANVYMSAYARLRVDIRGERAEADARERQAERLDRELGRADGPGR